MESPQIKQIIIQENSKKKEKREKREKKEQLQKKIEPKLIKKRVITTHNAWSFTPDDLSVENQWILLNEVYEDISSNIISDSKRQKQWLISQIKSKIYGYLGQDIEKREKNPDKLVDPVDFIPIHLSNILKKLVESNLDCFYCRGKVAILYEYVREPKQWTLERIDNKQSHHLGNVEIACLQCNLKRRTMYHERYVFTKQMTIQKLG
jgi:hypothetical protein